ncbi:MAG TPA: MazG nucleotide pyrophosphohydrolase domain-containing protein [Candidatus Saccharimonadales bacterium]|nr:MazG nucleotide pyrophosphohydrolase domain-containing protein [Candidatus Saccharimonadales bacterium]
MTTQEIQARAKQVRALYEKLAQKNYGRSWSREELMLGFVGDVGDLAKLAIAKEGVRDISDADQKLQHELADCLWSVLVLADAYGIDIEAAFTRTMDQLETRVNKELDV